MSAIVEPTRNHNHDEDERSAGPGRLARSTYEELRAGGFSDTDIMAFAGELLSLVATGVRNSNP